jgi:predicted nucleotidyltransferase
MITPEMRATILAHFEAHDFWRPHWPETAVVVVGSAARGRTDEFADVDVEVYVPKSSYDTIYESYAAAVERGSVEVLNPRALLFREFPLVTMPGIKGHYRVHTFEEVERRAAVYDDVTMWIHQRGLVTHDPSGRYGKLRQACSSYPKDVLREKVRHHVLSAISAESGASNPLRRGDRPAVTLTMTEGLRCLLRLCCLLDNRPFPYDKWLYREACDTTAGRDLQEVFQQLFEELARPEIRRAKREHYERPGDRNADLEEFPLYVLYHRARDYFRQRLAANAKRKEASR